MHWYNPRTREVEDVPAPSTDQEGLQMPRGNRTPGAFFVGHEFRLRHLRYQPIG
jgi:hypothetical protein